MRSNKRQGSKETGKVRRKLHNMDLLSLLANRIAKVTASGSPSLTSAAAFHTQLRSLPTLAVSFMSGTTVYDVSLHPEIYVSLLQALQKAFAHHNDSHRP